MNSDNSIPLPSVRSSKKNAAAMYLDALPSKASSVTMATCLNNISKVLGAESYDVFDWSKIRRSHWLLVHKSLAERNCSGATVNLYLTAFKSAAKEAWSLDILPQSAYLKIRALKSIPYERLPKGRSLNINECRKLLDSCIDGSVQGFRDRAIFALMLGCGLRRAEVVKLNMADWNSRELSFSFIGKGNKERKVYLPSDLESIFLEWLFKRGLQPGPLFPRMNPGGKDDKMIFKNMLPTSIYKILKKRTESTSLEGLKPHDLRRTFATRMLEAGCDVFILQRAMGHASVNTTARYDYRSEKHREEVCKALRF